MCSASFLFLPLSTIFRQATNKKKTTLMTSYIKDVQHKVQNI